MYKTVGDGRDEEERDTYEEEIGREEMRKKDKRDR